MCNENVNENAQIRPVCDTPDIEQALQGKRILNRRQMELAVRNYNMPKSERLCRLADENIELSRNIDKLGSFLGNNPERFTSDKQIELMRGQLKAMENYKFFLSCRIADLALSDFDLEPTEEKKGA
jgi:hypothetical protein